MAETEAEQELDLDQMWIKAQVEFQRMFPGRDPRYLPVLRVEDVIGMISQKKEADEKAGAKYRVAKDVLNKTLKCIQNLGALAIQGASMVFGPSNLCFNAVSYLVTTAQNYSKIFAGVAELFERVLAFLDRFEVYARAKSLGVRLDVHLKRIIHDLLQSFMRICALSLKISKEPRVLLALKVFSFNTDEGIQGELSKLESLVQRETGMSVALILEAAKINQANITTGFSEVKGSFRALDGKVDGITNQLSAVPGFLERQENAERRKETEDITKKNREKIRLALKIEADKESWRSYQENFWGTRVRGTGQWLMDDFQLSTWANRQAFAAPIFGLEAREGFGKSYLCSTVVRHLNNLYPPGRQDSRVSVAYYYFEKDNKDDKSVNKALRALVWQLTTNDPAYQKSVAVACDKQDEFGETLELWKQLVINLSKIDATFFVVLDGIDEAETEQGKPLLQIIRDVSSMANRSGQLNIRLFLTGRPKAFEEIEKDANIFIPKIGLGTRNRDDILKYVNMRMDNMDILKKSDQAVIEELRTRIRETLTQGAQGDFVKLDYKLSEISTKRRPKEFEEVLEHAGEDRQDTIAREVERLNETLGQEDIHDLNELLAWIIGAKQALTLPQLDAVLLVKNGEKSLVPLTEQIREKYAALMDYANNEQTVSLRSDSIIEYFRKNSKAAAEDQASGVTADLHKSEIAIVRRFLRSVCDDELFQKFGFEDFFRSKLGNRTALIHVDMEVYNIIILMCCLKAICGQQNDDMTPLLDYAFYWLPEHLEDVDLALADPVSKSFIGPLLLKLFVDEQIIDRWWTEERMWMRDWWVISDRYSGFVMSWFKDSAVVKGISDDEKEWINSLTSNSKPEEDLLKPTSVIMARRWLQSQDWFVTDIFQWLLSYITKIRSRKDNSERIIRDVNPTLDQILDLEAWAKTELRVDKPDSLWTVQMAITFRQFGFYKEAIERAHIAHDLDPENWRADFCLAQTYALENDYTNAIHTLSPLISALRADQERMRELRHVLYDEFLHFLGEWNSELGYHDAAMEAFREILENDPEEYKTALALITLLKKQEKFSEIIQFLLDMNKTMNEQGLSRLIAMYHKYADDPTYHDTISFAAQQSNSLKVIREAYQNAVEAAKEDASKLAILVALRYWYGLTLFHDHHAQEDQDEAVNFWEQNIAVADPSRRWDWGIVFTRRVTAAKLASVYLQRAKEAGFQSLTAQEYLKRLTFLSRGRIGGNEEEVIYQDIPLLLGRLYYLMGQEPQAKESMRGHVRVALDLLSDDDPSNDWQGYLALAVTLAPLNDDVNALAAWSLIGPVGDVNDQDIEHPDSVKPSSKPQLEEDKVGIETGVALTESINDRNDGNTPSTITNKITGLSLLSGTTDKVPTTGAQEVSSSSPQPEAATTSAAPQARHGELRLSCDGYCGQIRTFADDLYACKDCIDVQFEPGCLEKLQNGTLERKICNKAHEFLYVPKWDDDEHAKIPEGQVKVGEELVAVKDWLNEIRRQWGFDAVE